jgi:peptidoglycan/LPS O-acetylase OafA/YrhL
LVILITHTFTSEGMFWTAYGNTLLALLGTCVIAFLVTHSEGKLSAALSLRPLAYLGLISYGFYLWHHPILRILNGHISSSLIRIPLALVLSIIAAALSFHLLEQPLLRWRDANKNLRGDGHEGRRVAKVITQGSSSGEERR